MIIAISIVFMLLVLVALAFAIRTNVERRFLFVSALLVKCFAGVAVGWVYYYHYGQGDTIIFFNEAIELADLALRNPSAYFEYIITSGSSSGVKINTAFGDSRAILMVKIVSVFSLFSFKNYWIIALYFSIIAFGGAWYLVRQISRAFPIAFIPAAVAFLFVPSITFWTAGIIKETLAMAGLYFIAGILVAFWSNIRLRIVDVLLAIVSAVVLWKLKYYFAGIFLAVVLSTAIYRLLKVRIKTHHPFVSSVIYLGIFVVLIGGIMLLHPNFHPQKLLVVMVQNYDAFVKYSDTAEVIHYHNLQPTFISLLANAPAALVSGLYRPFIWESTNLLSLALSIENLFFFILTGIAVFHFKQIVRSEFRVLLLAIVLYVILLSVFITLSTPNFGTLARYRVGYLPFFVFLILLAPPIRQRLQGFFQSNSDGAVGIKK